MQYEADSPKAYIDMREDDWRKDKLMIIRSIILESQSIKKKMKKIYILLKNESKK